MADITPEQARDFYRAAASFYRQAPWRSVGDGETVKVACEQLEGGPWYAIVLGKRGTVKGLVLCDDWESRLLMGRGDYEAIADQLRNITVHYGSRRQVSPVDLAVAKQHGFEVAGTRAYPSAFRMERGREFRAPDAWELELLEACLWTIPDFLRRAEDRAPDVLEYAFTGTIGKMAFDLSWVRAALPRSDGPEQPD
jgi:hypothetical protein